MAYHSRFTSEDIEFVCGTSLLKVKGASSRSSFLERDPEVFDIIDEVIELYKPNIMFKNFEIKHASDRNLLYNILYLTKLIRKLKRVKGRRNAVQIANNLAHSEFACPGDDFFALSSLYPPGTGKERAKWKQYTATVRAALGMRMLPLLFPEGTPDEPVNKWWSSFAKNNFVGKIL
eukprot:gnl/Dysnectes_brevis/1189_a1329_3864.p1 GENE.gnl/Dysnectes_brevis/1189_a1329_3864~~gnl/Dysnectes_brevis/1189_a1329_3864.p1  ORF type:complete len:189 (+),score=41.48 gnl/Dysnectes_brevis/1189_a1329_3864:40-567(+)